MPTKKHRYMIVLDEETDDKLYKIMRLIQTRQRSKAIKFILDFYKTEELENLIKEILEINN